MSQYTELQYYCSTTYNVNGPSFYRDWTKRKVGLLLSSLDHFSPLFFAVTANSQRRATETESPFTKQEEKVGGVPFWFSGTNRALRVSSHNFHFPRSLPSSHQTILVFVASIQRQQNARFPK